MTRTLHATGSFAIPAWLAAALLTVAAGGCDPGASTEGLADRLEAARKENVELREKVTRLEADLKARDEQITRLQGLGGKRTDLLFTVASIRLGRTSGVDTDGKPGDDGVRVYLKCIDRDGHAIKAAGDVTIQLFDLSTEAKENLLARYDFSTADAAKHFSGGLLMNQYKFDCPWKTAPPPRADITIRATFTEYLTGKTFTTQKPITLNLPAATTQPR